MSTPRVIIRLSVAALSPPTAGRRVKVSARLLLPLLPAVLAALRARQLQTPPQPYVPHYCGKVCYYHDRTAGAAVCVALRCWTRREERRRRRERRWKFQLRRIQSSKHIFTTKKEKKEKRTVDNNPITFHIISALFGEAQATKPWLYKILCVVRGRLQRRNVWTCAYWRATSLTPITGAPKIITHAAARVTCRSAPVTLRVIASNWCRCVYRT